MSEQYVLEPKIKKISPSHTSPAHPDSRYTRSKYHCFSFSSHRVNVVEIVGIEHWETKTMKKLIQKTTQFSFQVWEPDLLNKA